MRLLKRFYLTLSCNTFIFSPFRLMTVFLTVLRHWILPQLTLDDAEAVGVVGAEGAEGREAPLWEAEEEERVGEALREPGLERRPRERNVVRL